MEPSLYRLQLGPPSDSSTEGIPHVVTYQIGSWGDDWWRLLMQEIARSHHSSRVPNAHILHCKRVSPRITVARFPDFKHDIASFEHMKIFNRLPPSMHLASSCSKNFNPTMVLTQASAIAPNIGPMQLAPFISQNSIPPMMRPGATS